MRRLHAVVNEVSGPDYGCLNFYAVDTSLLSRRSEELKKLADLAASILPAISHLQSTLIGMQNAWRSSAAEFEEKLRLLNKHLVGNAS